MKVKCPYCGNPAKLVKGDEIYPGRSSTAMLNYWECLPCGAYVGCHKSTTSALGSLANYELRQARSKAHESFDPIWREPRKSKMNRTLAYSWLSRQTGIPYKECHIAMMTIDQCEKVILITTQYKEILKK